MRSALESNGVVKGGIFDVDAARNIYQLSRVQAEQAARNSREQADRAAEQAQVTRLVEGTEVSTSEYIVKPGDNLTKIAHKHGITLTELLQANKDIDPKKPIHPKDRIVIPARKPEASKPAEAPAK
jgi:LysM repeat protein